MQTDSKTPIDLADLARNLSIWIGRAPKWCLKKLATDVERSELARNVLAHHLVECLGRAKIEILQLPLDASMFHSIGLEPKPDRPQKSLTSDV